MSYRSFNHSSSYYPYENNFIHSLSTLSISTSSTLQDRTPSDSTCIVSPEDAPKDVLKSVRFGDVDLVIQVRGGNGGPPSQVLETNTSSSYLPSHPPPMTIPTSTYYASNDISTTFRDVGRSQVPMVSSEPDPRFDEFHVPQFVPPIQHFDPPFALLPSSRPPVTTPSVKEITFRSAEPPDASVCGDVNDVLKKYFGIPNFDFATYAQDRVYVVRRVYLGSAACGYPDPASDSQSECVALLEKSFSVFFSPSRLRQLSPQPAAVQPSLFQAKYVDSRASFVNHGCGASMVAQKQISTHQLILVERPCAVFPYMIALEGPHKKVYLEVFRRLSPSFRSAVAEFDGRPPLPNQKFDEYDYDESCDYEDIIIRHSYLIDLEVPVESNPRGELSAHRGLFLKASKIQHSCRPNAVWFWDPRSFSIIIRAVRPISPGEEITIPFVPPELPYRERKSRLNFIKAFTCLCKSCFPGPCEGTEERAGRPRDTTGNVLPAIQEGDAAREYLLRFRSVRLRSPNSSCQETNFQQWLVDKCIPESSLISAHERALSLIAKEGLQILDTQQRVSSSQSTFDPSFSFIRTSQSSSPGRPIDTIIPCHQRDVGFHTDILVLCYGALGDTPKFILNLEKATKDRDERSAWLLVALNLETDEYRNELERERAENEMASNLRLVFLKWAANPTTFPLWERRKSKIGMGAASPGNGHGNELEVYDSLDDYALHCLAV